MSELRVGLVAEGLTDQIIIEAALKAILPKPFRLTLLQPEPTHPGIGGGWGGVFKWCRDFSRAGHASLEDDPKWGFYDLVIIHLDADVAEKSYADCGGEVARAAESLLPLPCSRPCPPPSDTIHELESLLLNWLGIARPGPRTVFCVPSKVSDAWLAAAYLPSSHSLLSGLECNLDLGSGLSRLPKKLRLRKSSREYRLPAKTITTNWATVLSLCSQAAAFQSAVEAKS